MKVSPLAEILYIPELLLGEHLVSNWRAWKGITGPGSCTKISTSYDFWW